MDFNETFWRGWAFAKEDLVISIWYLIFFYLFFYHFSVFYKHTKKMRADVRGSMTFILYKYISCTISIWRNTHGTSHFSWDMEVGVWWSSGVMTKSALFQSKTFRNISSHLIWVGIRVRSSIRKKTLFLQAFCKFHGTRVGLSKKKIQLLHTHHITFKRKFCTYMFIGIPEVSYKYFPLNWFGHPAKVQVYESEKYQDQDLTGN